MIQARCASSSRRELLKNSSAISWAAIKLASHGLKRRATRTFAVAG